MGGATETEGQRRSDRDGATETEGAEITEGTEHAFDTEARRRGDEGGGGAPRGRPAALRAAGAPRRGRIHARWTWALACIRPRRGAPVAGRRPAGGQPAAQPLSVSPVPPLLRVDPVPFSP